MTDPINMSRIGRPRKHDYDAIALDYLNGMTWEDICEKHQCQFSTVSHALRDMSTTPHRQVDTEQVDEMVRLYEVGRMSGCEIADVMGCSLATVYYHLNRRGVKLGVQRPQATPNFALTPVGKVIAEGLE